MTLQELQDLYDHELNAIITTQLKASGNYVVTRVDFTDLDTLIGYEDDLLQDGTRKLAWLNNLRRVLEPFAPKNKVGAPIISDYDLLRMKGRRRAEAYYLTLTK